MPAGRASGEGTARAISGGLPSIGHLVNRSVRQIALTVTIAIVHNEATTAAAKTCDTAESGPGALRIHQAVVVSPKAAVIRLAGSYVQMSPAEKGPASAPAAWISELARNAITYSSMTSRDRSLVKATEIGTAT
jgi:hypothetical protein